MSVTRFAPSPSGLLHLGHALAAHVAWEAAQSDGGTFLLRIEDIDVTRCKPEYETMLKEDLRWLGFTWPEPVRRQTEHLGAYAAALERLKERGLVYPCFCTRAMLQRELAGVLNAPHGPEGPLYPGTCRSLSAGEREDRLDAGEAPSWRLDTGHAAKEAGPLTWRDRNHGSFTAAPELLGDVILARKGIATSYHLSVVVDDAAQGVTLVTRGEDLLPCTHIHRLLQALLCLPVPGWAHHRLMLDDEGRRLAKRHDALSLRALREAGRTPGGIRAMIQ